MSIQLEYEAMKIESSFKSKIDMIDIDSRPSICGMIEYCCT